MPPLLVCNTGGGAAASFAPADAPLRLSLKLHGVSPAQLSPGLLPHLNVALAGGAAAVESGFMRPGCVHLTLQLRAQLPASPETTAGTGWAGHAAAQAAAAELLCSSMAGMDAATWASVLTNEDERALALAVQLPGSGALMMHGGARLAVAAPRLPAPALQALLPCCMVSSARSSAVLWAVGSSLDAPGVTVLARSQGMHLPAERQATQQATACSSSAGSSSTAAAAPVGRVALRLQRLPAAGLVHVEFQQHGGLLSAAKPLLVVDSPAVAAELQHLQQQVAAGGEAQAEAEQVLISLGRLLDFRAASLRHGEEEADTAGQLHGSGGLQHAAGQTQQQQQQLPQQQEAQQEQHEQASDAPVVAAQQQPSRRKQTTLLRRISFCAAGLPAETDVAAGLARSSSGSSDSSSDTAGRQHGSTTRLGSVAAASKRLRDRLRRSLRGAGRDGDETAGSLVTRSVQPQPGRTQDSSGQLIAPRCLSMPVHNSWHGRGAPHALLLRAQRLAGAAPICDTDSAGEDSEEEAASEEAWWADEDAARVDAARAASQHPLLTAEYKACMM